MSFAKLVYNTQYFPDLLLNGFGMMCFKAIFHLKWKVFNSCRPLRFSFGHLVQYIFLRPSFNMESSMQDRTWKV